MTMIDRRLGWGNARLVVLGDVENAPELSTQDPIRFQQDAEKTVFAAQGELEQGWSQLAQAMRAGATQDQVTIHQQKLQMLAEQLSKLQDAAAGAKQTGDMQLWQRNAQGVVTQVHSELQTIVNLNAGSITTGTYKSLLLGFGVAAVVAVAGFYVWKRSKRGRRK
jgi:hypothetical protein